jgi:hypothetical protein
VERGPDDSRTSSSSPSEEHTSHPELDDPQLRDSIQMNPQEASQITSDDGLECDRCLGLVEVKASLP